MAAFDDEGEPNDWYYNLPTDSEGEEELVELEYYDGYFHYQGEIVDIDVDEIIWAEDEEIHNGEVAISEDEVEVEAVRFSDTPEATEVPEVVEEAEKAEDVPSYTR